MSLYTSFSSKGFMCRFTAWVVVASMNLSLYAPMVSAEENLPDVLLDVNGEPLDIAVLRSKSEQTDGSILLANAVATETREARNNTRFRLPEGASVLPKDRLENTFSNVPNVFSPEEKPLPKAFSLAKTLSPVAIATVLPAVTQSAILPEAQLLFDEAVDLDRQGKPVDACSRYLQVMENHSGTVSSKVAYDRLAEFSARTIRGEFPLSEVARFGDLLPAWQDCKSLETKFVVLGYNFGVAGAMKKMGSDTGAKAYYQKTYDNSLSLMGEAGDNPIQAYAMLHLIDAAKELGTLDAAYAAIAATIRPNETPMANLIARGYIGTHHLEKGEFHKAKTSFFHLTKYLDNDRLEEILADPSVFTGVKKWYLFLLGTAYLVQKEHDPAEYYFGRIKDDFTESSAVDERAEYWQTVLESRAHHSTPYESLVRYQGLLDKYPTGKTKSAVLIKMAEVYIDANDFINAIDVLDEIVRLYPNTNSGLRADRYIDYILEHLIGDVEVARQSRLPQEILAQACGPIALHYMLAGFDIKSTVDELAQLANTTIDGTSMLALQRAARRKGVSLIGMRVGELNTTPTPFIAFVNNDHFVLVEEITKSDVVIRDNHKPLTEMSKSEFQTIWDGKALILGNQNPRVAQASTSFSMNTISGGDGIDPPDCDNLGVYPNCENDQESNPDPGSGNDTNADGNDDGAEPKNTGAEVPDPGGEDCDGCPCPPGEMGMPDMDGETGGANFGGAAGGVRPQSPPPLPKGSGKKQEQEQGTVDPLWDGPGPSPRTGGGTQTSSNRKDNKPWVKPPFMVSAGIGSPGISAKINVARSGIHLAEHEIVARTHGKLVMNHTRLWTNPYGVHRTLDTGMGVGWLHNYYYKIKYDDSSSLALDTLTVTGTTGKPVTYKRYAQLGTDWYTTSGIPPLAEETYISRNQTTGVYVMYLFGGLRREFTPDGSITAWMSAYWENGYYSNKVTLTYGTDGVTRVDAPTGDARYLEYTYDTNGLITKVELKNATETIRTVAYTYQTIVDQDTSLNTYHLYKVTEDDETTFIQYDITQDNTYQTGTTATANIYYISKITDKAGTAWDFAYTFTGIQSTAKEVKLEVTHPDGVLSTYDMLDRVTTVTHSKSGVTLNKAVYKYNDTTKTRETNYYLEGSTTSYEQWLYAYDVDNNLASITAPGETSPHVSYEYDSSSRITKTIEGDDSATDPTIEYFYTAGDISPTKIVDATGSETHITFNSLGNRLIEIKTSKMETTDGIKLAYDSDGNLNKVTNQYGKIWTATYNDYGQYTSVTNPLGETTTNTYNAKGQLTEVENDIGQRVTYTYSTGGCTPCGSFGLVTSVKRYTDATNYIEQTYEYDVNSNVTKTTNAQGKSTTYTYDNRNRVTEVDYLDDNLKTTKRFYADDGLLDYVTGSDGTSVVIDYDHMSQVVAVSESMTATQITNYNAGTYDPFALDSALDITYDTMGKVTKIEDAEGNDWDYFYDGYNNLDHIIDAQTKEVHYDYDAAGRVTHVGTGTSGTTDPIDYTYDNTGTTPTGRLLSVQYDGLVARTVDYTYNTGGRMTKMTDWLDGTDGIQYAYDDIGRVNQVTDYDGSTLKSTFDSIGRITDMYDYHDNRTSYTYTALNQLDTMTAPGSKVWDFDYDTAGLPTSYTHPNGMTTEYTYDATEKILTKIAHKDGAVVKQSFEYTYDDAYNITKIVHEDGSLWDYGYDDRYRLTSATRSNAASPNDTIEAAYSYVYDDADNMTSKTEPFVDDFNDYNSTGWTVTSGSWNLANGDAQNNYSATDHTRLALTTTDEDLEIKFDVVNRDTSVGNHLYVYPRLDGGDQIQLRFNKSWAQVYKRVNSMWTQIGIVAAAMTQDVVYTIRIVCDGDDLNIYRAEAGGLETELFDLTDTDLNFAAQDYLLLMPSAGSKYTLDNIRILADDLSRTTTMVFNSANELLTSADYNGTISYVYDDSGRTTSKTRGTDVAAYSWGYGDMLQSVDSDFPDEGDVDYTYAGGVGRAKRTTLGGDYTWYNGNSDEAEGVNGDGDGALTRSYYGNADVVGSDPATGDYRYYMTDHLGSTRSVFDENKNLIASYDYTPYGAFTTKQGPADITILYTGHDWDEASQLYYAPYRFLDPDIARWMKRDPYGMVDGPNMFTYVAGNPIMYVDLTGLSMGDFWDDVQGGLDIAGLYPGFGEIADLTNAGISAGRGNWGDAGLNLACAVPGFGWGAAAAKAAKKAKKWCFVAGTFVSTPDGLREIETIQEGDAVWSYDIDTGEATIQYVSHAFVLQADEIISIYTDEEIIETTAEHPFFVEGTGWINAGDLTEGSLLTTLDGEQIEVTKVSVRQESTTVYNFEVENTHTYYVADAQILVHNAKCSKGGGRKPKTDIPSWAQGKKPEPGQNVDDWLTDLLDEKYGEGNWKKGSGSEWSKIRKKIQMG